MKFDPIMPVPIPEDQIKVSDRPYAQPSYWNYPICDPVPKRRWIFDVDGTLALRPEGGRSPYDWDRVSEDVPNGPVIEMVQSLLYAGVRGIVVSGRNEVCRCDTAKWLDDHVWNSPFGYLGYRIDEIFMRPDTDEWRNEPDDVLKEWILNTKILPRYGESVSGAIDDRNKVVEMWRRNGIMCAQVAPGNF